MINEGKTHTSNNTKLLKHLDTLQLMQNGVARPILLEIIPTHRCNLNCVHCCFKNRIDREADIDFDILALALESFRKLGTKSIEKSGGGDPTLYPHIDKSIQYAKDLGYNIGLITNGLDTSPLGDISRLSWMRISLNTLDYKTDIPNISSLKEKTHISFCYIWNKYSKENFKKIAEFSKKYSIVCRLAPDCIVPLEEIHSQVKEMKKLNEEVGNEFTFVSDFNIQTTRRNNKCFMHMIKPCLYLDGYIYACPSVELSLEANKQISESTRICHVNDILKTYSSVETKSFNCSFCKYASQNELLEEVLDETSFNEFV